MTSQEAIARLTSYVKGEKSWSEIVSSSTENFDISIEEDGILVLQYEDGNCDRYTAKSYLDSIETELCGMSVLDRKIDRINWYIKS